MIISDVVVGVLFVFKIPPQVDAEVFCWIVVPDVVVSVGHFEANHLRHATKV